MQQDQIAKDINKLNKLLVKVENRPSTSTALLKKVKSLYHKLFRYFSTGKIKKIALSSAAALLLQTNATAQNFGTVSAADPYGLDISKIYSVQPILVDMDNDGDQDIIYCDKNSSNLRYVPNNTPTGGAIIFGGSQINPFGFIKSDAPNGSSAIGDIDNDGDVDLLYYNIDFYTYTGNFVYYANTGTATAPIFGASTTNPFNLATPANTQISNVSFADLDNDGDLDIISLGYNTVTFLSDHLYFENTSTTSTPSFSTGIINTFGIPSSVSVYNFIDLDNDNDLDLLAKGTSGIYYYENTGSASSPVFGTAQINPFNIDATPGGNTGVNFTFGDINGDGKADLISKTNSNVYVQLNTTPTSVGKVQKQDLDISIYPTPSHDLVNVKLGKQDDYTLEVFNLQGQQLQVQSIQQATEHQLNLSELASGQYLLKISTDDHYTTKQLIKQ